MTPFVILANVTEHDPCLFNFSQIYKRSVFAISKIKIDRERGIRQKQFIISHIIDMTNKEI